MVKNNAEMRQRIEDWFEFHSEDMIGDLGRLIAINSVRGVAEDGAPYGYGPREALTLVRSMLEKRGFAVSDFENIIITADIGPSPPLLGILAHVDVVSAGDDWDTDPFEMTVVNGKIFGRGAIDDKGPAIASMYAMYCAHELCPEFRNGFRLLLGSGEEIGCVDIARYLEKNSPPPQVFTPDSDYPVVNVEKGRITPFFSALWAKDSRLPRVVSISGGKTTNVVPDRTEAVIEGFSIDETESYCLDYSEKTGASIFVREDSRQLIVTATGVSAHAATPQMGVNAQTALIEMLAAMPFADSIGFKYICALNRLFPHGDYHGRALGIAMSDKIAGELTVNFGVLRFTETDFTGNFDSRTPACADDADLPGMVRAAFDREGITMTSSTISHCHYTPGDSPFVQTLLRIYEEYTGNAGGCLAVGGQTYVHEIPGGVAFGCEMPGVDNSVHGANEFIGVEQLITSAKMFAMAILEICGAQSAPGVRD